MPLVSVVDVPDGGRREEETVVVSQRDGESTIGDLQY
jgi:hypothetical protein